MAKKASVVLNEDGDAFWVPGNRTARINGRRIGGFVYVGEGLCGAIPGSLEPSLINPRLAINASVKDCSKKRSNYYPSYARNSPKARAAFLNWLATGRDNPQADIGYVFLYFYGLERRAFRDTQTSTAARAELGAIEDEVERLLSIYGSNSSFRRYARHFLDMLWAQDTTRSAHQSTPPPTDLRGLTTRLSLGLGQFAAAGKPLPAGWALAWLYIDRRARLDGPAKRFRDKFEQLFAEQYRASFGEGLVLPKTRKRLTLTYHFASDPVRRIERRFDLPAVYELSAPFSRLQRLAHKCETELNNYSRAVAGHSERTDTFEAVIELPITIWPKATRKAFTAVKTIIAEAGERTAMPFSTLKALFPQWTAITKAKLQSVARALAQIGIAIEPDPRLEAKLPDDGDHIVLFEADSEPAKRPSARYTAAAVIVRLGVLVASADGLASEPKTRLLRDKIEEWPNLSDSERRRLNAHLSLHLAHPPRLAGLKSHVRPLSRRTRGAVGDFLALLSQVDGTVTIGQVSVLENVFRLLGLDPGTVYSKVHFAATKAPIVVRSAQPGSRHTITKRRSTKPAAAVTLDQARISALNADSKRVASMLGDIFVGEPRTPSPIDGKRDIDLQEQSILGLEPPLSAFVHALLKSPEWSRVRLEKLAADHGLMLDGSLERINDAALEAHDAPLIEGADPIHLNKDLISEITR